MIIHSTANAYVAQARGRARPRSDVEEGRRRDDARVVSCQYSMPGPSLAEAVSKPPARAPDDEQTKSLPFTAEKIASAPTPDAVGISAAVPIATLAA